MGLFGRRSSRVEYELECEACGAEAEVYSAPRLVPQRLRTAVADEQAIQHGLRHVADHAAAGENVTVSQIRVYRPGEHDS